MILENIVLAILAFIGLVCLVLSVLLNTGIIQHRMLRACGAAFLAVAVVGIIRRWLMS